MLQGYLKPFSPPKSLDAGGPPHPQRGHGDQIRAGIRIIPATAGFSAMRRRI